MLGGASITVVDNEVVRASVWAMKSSVHLYSRAKRGPFGGTVRHWFAEVQLADGSLIGFWTDHEGVVRGRSIWNRDELPSTVALGVGGLDFLHMRIQSDGTTSYQGRYEMEESVLIDRIRYLVSDQGYDLVVKNCESAAMYLATGQFRSEQVRVVAVFGVLVAFVAMAWKR